MQRIFFLSYLLYGTSSYNPRNWVMLLEASVGMVMVSSSLSGEHPTSSVCFTCEPTTTSEGSWPCYTLHSQVSELFDCTSYGIWQKLHIIKPFVLKGLIHTIFPVYCEHYDVYEEQRQDHNTRSYVCGVCGKSATLLRKLFCLRSVIFHSCPAPSCMELEWFWPFLINVKQSGLQDTAVDALLNKHVLSS